MATDEPRELHVLILAAGGSQRFGSPKQLLLVDNETLLHRVCRAALSVCPHVTVVLGAHAEIISRAIEDLPLMRITNPDWNSGMSSSLRAGVLSLPATADGVMIMLTDQPFLTAEHLQQLASEWYRQPESIVAGSYSDTTGVPVIFPRDEFARLASLSGDHGARGLLETSDCRVVTVAMPAAAHDIDTSSDADRVQKQMNVDIRRPDVEAVPDS